MKKDLKGQQLLLANYMSHISERCYYAGWIQGLEYILWNALLHGEKKYGQANISQNDIEILKDLSNATNSWIIFDNETEETAMDMDAWKHKFNQDVEQNPKLIKT